MQKFHVTLSTASLWILMKKYARKQKKKLHLWRNYFYLTISNENGAVKKWKYNIDLYQYFATNPLAIQPATMSMIVVSEMNDGCKTHFIRTEVPLQLYEVFICAVPLQVQNIMEFNVYWTIACHSGSSSRVLYSFQWEHRLKHRKEFS